MGLDYCKSILLLLLVAGLVDINKALTSTTDASNTETTTSLDTTTTSTDTTTIEATTTVAQTTSAESTTIEATTTVTETTPTDTTTIEATTTVTETTPTDTTTIEATTTPVETTPTETTTVEATTTVTETTPTDTTTIEATTTVTETTPGPTTVETSTAEATTTVETTSAETTTVEATTTVETTSAETTTVEATTTVETTSAPTTVESTPDITTKAEQATTSSSEGTTAEMPICPAGKFGSECTFLCLCANLTEACDSRSGFCRSGCPSGRQGPGCNLTTGGDEPVVVVLGLLLAMALLFALAVLALLVRTKRQQAYASSAENYAYEFPEMEAPKLADGLERIRETDIQVHTDPLGEGRFGDILPGKIQRGKRRVDVAFKTLKDGSTEDERNGLMAQLQMYSKLEPHSYVIQFYGVCTVGGQIYAAFEYAANGNLRNYLRRSSMPESETSSDNITRNETLLINYCLEVCQGMQYLASKKLVHRELMARHIMVDKKNVCKVAGLNATPREEKNYPVRWMAPESLQEKIFNHQSDVWSFGVLMWEVMSLGGQPYPDVSTKDLTSLITGTYRMSPPEDCSLEVFDVMKSCWEEDPQARPTFADLVDKLHIAMAAVDEASIAIDTDSEGMEGLD